MFLLVPIKCPISLFIIRVLYCFSFFSSFLPGVLCSNGIFYFSVSNFSPAVYFPLFFPVRCWFSFSVDVSSSLCSPCFVFVVSPCCYFPPSLATYIYIYCSFFSFRVITIRRLRLPLLQCSSDPDDTISHM